METKPQSLLELAFNHLEGFSIPRIGTFIRRYQASAIDHKDKKVMPPAKVFTLEKGEERIEHLQSFFRKRFDISPTKSEVWVEVLSSFIEKKIGEAGKLRVSGFGEISKNAEDGYKFQAEEIAQSDFFGLSPVGYKLGSAVKASEEDKKKAARNSVLANTTKVEDAPPPRRRRSWPIILFILLLAVAGTGFIFRAEVKTWLTDMGLLASNETPSGETTEPLALNDNDPEEGTDSEGAEEGTTVDTDPPIDNEGTGEEENPVNDPGEELVIEETDTPDTELAEEEVPYTLPADLGNRPQSGQYYLVVASGKEPAEVRGMARRIKNSKVLRPARAGNFYRISVFNSSSKKQVIQKMVELKKTHSNSWIYYLGM